MTNDEANKIYETIEMMKTQSIICEKCEKAECCCKYELAFKLPEYDDEQDDLGECDFCGAIKCAGSCIDNDF